MCRVGLTVDFNPQFATGGIGAQVGAGGEEASDETAGVIMAFEGFPGNLHEGGFGAVGDEFDGVNEVLSAAGKLGKTLLRRKVFELDVFGVVFAFGFEGVELAPGGS